MKRAFLECAVALTISVPVAAYADTAIITGDRGETFEIVATRELPNDMRGAVVEIVSGSGVMAMEYGFDCASGRYSYLGMMHDGVGPWLDAATVTKLQGYSDSIIGDNLRGVTLTPISSDPIDKPIADLMAETCRPAMAEASSDALIAALPVLPEPQHATFVGSGGSQHVLYGTRPLSNGLRGAVVQIARERSPMLMEYGFGCGSREYVYLGMSHDTLASGADDPALDAVRGYTDNIISTGLQKLPLTTLSSEDYDDTIEQLYAEACR